MNLKELQNAIKTIEEFNKSLEEKIEKTHPELITCFHSVNETNSELCAEISIFDIYDRKKIVEISITEKGLRISSNTAPNELKETIKQIILNL